jgi:hypothetical protein
LTDKLNARLGEINLFIEDNNDNFKIPYDSIDLFDIDIDEWDGILEDPTALHNKQPFKKSVQMRESIRNAIALIKKQLSEF